MAEISYKVSITNEAVCLVHRLATTLYAWSDGKHIRYIEAVHCGREPLFLAGCIGRAYDLGDVAALVARGGRDLAELLPAHSAGVGKDSP